MIAQWNNKKDNDNHVHGCKTAKEIWGTLKENYQGNEWMMKIFVTKCLY